MNKVMAIDFQHLKHYVELYYKQNSNNFLKILSILGNTFDMNSFVWQNYGFWYPISREKKVLFLTCYCTEDVKMKEKG